MEPLWEDARDALVVVDEQQKGATAAAAAADDDENDESSETVCWQKIVDVHVADWNELPHGISRSILADFKSMELGVDSTKCKNDDAPGEDILQDFLLHHIAVFTSPKSKASERRKSLGTVQSFLARIDQAKQEAATATIRSSSSRGAGAYNMESSDSPQVDRESSLAGQQQLPKADVGVEQSVPKASGLRGSNDMEFLPLSQSMVTPLINQAGRKGEASTATEHANKAVECGRSGHENDCVMDRSDHEIKTGNLQANKSHSTARLGPKDIVIGPLYAKIDNLGKILFEKTVHDYALRFSRCRTTEKKKDVCRKIFCFLLASGVRFLHQESEVSFATMKDGDILELLQATLSKVGRKKKQCLRPTIDGRNQQNQQSSKSVTPTAVEQPTSFERKIPKSQITNYDVLMVKGYSLPRNRYLREQYNLRRKQGYQHNSSAYYAISRVHQSRGRFLKPADASGALWREVGTRELLESIKKKESSEEQPEEDLTTTGTLRLSTKGQQAGARTLAPRSVERESFAGSLRERCRCTERDVLLGNFEFASSWPGNKVFAQLLDHYGRKYALNLPGQKQIERKALIAREAIKEIIANGGLFLQHFEGKTGPETLVEMEWLPVDLNNVEKATHKLIPDADTQRINRDSCNVSGACKEGGQVTGDKGSAHSCQAHNGQFPSIPVASSTYLPDGAATLGGSRFTRATDDPEVIDLTDDLFDTE